MLDRLTHASEYQIRESITKNGEIKENETTRVQERELLRECAIAHIHNFVPQERDDVNLGSLYCYSNPTDPVR